MKMKNNVLLETAAALLESQPNRISLLSNAAAFLNDHFDQINWVGFYLYDGKILTVGPFQGKVACSEIELGKGVCGEAAVLRKTLVIKDVLSHANHIACDENSKSEVVVPIYIEDKLFGVLDCDAPIFDRFDEEIVLFFEEFVLLLIKQLTITTL
ncbi:MAG: Free methionine-(R)-sulfoxide reductase [Tenericutes bacterium HGW-Tenericutes-6]|nr:MAG: Free methionine-(R)-sulfoxide reductase [Tenericutes bacterium HGW-Tenericutes-6]